MRTKTAITLSEDVTDLVDHIATRFNPAQIILFGSHATGTAADESDVDLLVVTETGGRPIRRAVEIFCTLDHRFAVDLFVRSPEQLEKPSPSDILLREILAEGVTVYEAED
jgi:uncharacterized protein